MMDKAMDNNQNQEGLDGLPLEPWMNRQHLSSVHPGLSTQVFNQHMSAQPMHDFLSHRSLQTFTTADPTPHVIVENSKTLSSSAHQQYSLSNSARLHQPEHLSLSHERSAWSHLLALDPTKAAPMGSHLPDPQLHCLTQDTPLVQNTRQEQPLLMLKGDTKLTAFDSRSLNLPKLSFALASSSTASIPHDNYSQLSTVRPPQNKMSQQFNQPMNISKATYASKPAAPQSLAISTDVSSLESSGSYSPVSPPATSVDVDEPSISNSGQNSGRAADLFLRESHEISSATFPLFSASDHADIFNYLSGKADTFSSDINMQDSYSESAKSFTDSGLFSSPSEVPLDMTTAFSSKETSQAVAGVALSSDSVTNGKSSITETLLTKDSVHLKDSVSETNTTGSTTDRNQSQFSLPVICDDKITKLVKSTPKKSNFYGRDASLFSFMPSPSYIGDTPVSEHQSSDLVITDAIESKHVFNSTNEVSPESLSIQVRDKVSAAGSNTAVTSNTTMPSVNTLSHAEPVIFPPDSVVNVSAGSSNLQTSDCNTNQTWNNYTVGKSLDSKETLVTESNDMLTADNSEDNDLPQDDLKEMFSSNDETVIGDTDTPEKEHSEESTDNWNQNVDMQEQVNEDFPTVQLKRKPKAPKRKKRKASGFQTRQRKKPVRKQLQIHQPEVFDNGGLNMEVNHSNTDVNVQGSEIPELQINEQISYSNETVAVKRKTRRASNAKTPSADLTPRRSSSRKSKDNAMRLIELQADSNYSGISEPAPVVEKKATRKKKNSKLSSALISGDDFSDGDSTEEYKSDENDGDYVFDEDEIEEVDNDEALDQPTGKKIKEKRLGSLKISIKLSGNSSAEIVSGIDDSPATKKRKTAKKKSQKTKSKNKVKTIKEYEEAEIIQEPLNSSGTGEDVEESVNSLSGDKTEDAGNSSDAKDRHMSLMEKYFLTASTATAARQTQKKAVSGKESAAQKKNVKSAKSKLGKNVALKSGTLNVKKQNEQSKELQQKASVKPGIESTVQNDKAEKGVTQDDAETGVAKFVCGYCPQRYHNKQELLAHMEAHMVEMEKTSDTEVNENKKAQSITTNLAVSRDPRSNRSGNAEVISGKPSSAENIAEKVKVKPVADLVKESKDSNVKSVQDTLKQKLKCGECGEVFDSKPNLLEHVRIHTTDKPFECDICHKCFTERNLLSVHRKTHGQEKLLRCHMCSKAFVDKTDLNLHMQSHPRRSNTKSADKHMLPIKKSLKRSLQDKQDYEDPVVSKKPKSFASALTGEMEMLEKTTDTPSLVLVMTRSDGPGTETKNSSSSGSKPVLIEPKVSLKPVTANIFKPTIVKTVSYTKKPVEIPIANSSVKGDSSRMDGKDSNVVTNSSEAKKSEAVSPSVCTCKECPDCVTRFLQSFE